VSLRDRVVVESDDRHGARHVDTTSTQFGEGAEGNQVAAADDGPHTQRQ
jgi:hypothetical protein